jgi:uncharacterized protein YyaL (SSP411 family)
MRSESMVMNRQRPNKLIDTQSPYLQQHAFNPVNWYPWSDEALARARDESKPILLSIGYSTCHWCHVMEQESFSDESVAELMNQHFICIKVDREERPDLDKIYITAVSAMSGSAGWPLNVFLTPERLPFFGGTYFPPQARPGIPSWTAVLTKIAEHWSRPGSREKLETSGVHIRDTLAKHLAWRQERQYDSRVHARTVDRLAAAFDKQAGGFSRAPKFPSPGILQYLMTYYAAQPHNDHLDRERAEQGLRMAMATLQHMARGGVFDHVGGGFHRYATDDQWQLPHFEKMLYDNAQLLSAYTQAYQLTANREMAETARRTADYVLRDLQHPAGGFYAAEDADSLPINTAAGAGSRAAPNHHKEGAFYIWTADEIDNWLTPLDAAVVKHHSNIRPAGNAVQDPHGEFEGFNILFQARPIAETAAALSLTEAEVAAAIERAQQQLFTARSQRTRPHCDRKIITAWNGLMISALAQAYQAFGDARYLKAARRAADFILEHLYDHASQSLFRCRVGDAPEIPGIADDHLFFGQALLDLYASDFQPHWLKKARTLMDKTIALFYDADAGGFFMTRRDHDPNLILRVKEDNDSVLPSAASVGALNLIRLARLNGQAEFTAMARKTINSGLARMQAYPEALTVMLTAALHAEAPLVQVTVTGSPADPVAAAMIAAARSPRLIGNTLAVVASETPRQQLATEVPFAHQVVKPQDAPQAWVWINRSCRDPVASAEALRAVLDAAVAGQPPPPT